MTSTASPGQGRTPTGAPIRCEGLVRVFENEGIEAVALQALDLVVAAGELVAVVGASGAGKSTLLNILAGLDVPSAGQVLVDGTDLSSLTASERIRYRRELVGFVRRQTASNLLPYLTARENVCMPLSLRGVDRAAQIERADDLLGWVGLADRAELRPGRLSSGEQQRVAIAVALANGPRLLLADEPTGELDPATASEVMEVLRSVAVEGGVTTVIVTNDPAVSERADRTVTIRDGRVSSDRLAIPDPLDAAGTRPAR